jgi:hypothetical protein
VRPCELPELIQDLHQVPLRHLPTGSEAGDTLLEGAAGGLVEL